MDARTAIAFNALSRVLAEHDCFVPLSVRRKATEAALAAADASVAPTEPTGHDRCVRCGLNYHGGITCAENTAVMRSFCDPN